MRQTAKRAFERLLRIIAGDPRRMAGRSLVLAYHNVVPDQEADRGDRSLHLPRSAFLRQLDRLQEYCSVVSLQAILEDAIGGDRPRIAVTFDDAYRGAVELGLPELVARGLPATLFVAPGLLAAQALWWDGWAESSEGLSEERRHRILEDQAGQSEVPAGIVLPRWYQCARQDEVLALARTGVSLGAHSWSHPNLAALGSDQLLIELTRPLEWLRQNGASYPALAYPYGLYSPAVEKAAAAMGYVAAFRVDGGWLAATRESRWALPRFNVPAGLSEDGFCLRLAGRLSG